MDELGRSTFSEDQNGRILDRLAGLGKVISRKQITNLLKATHKQSVRRCRLTNEIMILVILAMGLFTEQTLYFRNGKKATETPHDNAVAHGTCRHYLPDGRLFGLSTFAEGIEIRKQVIIEPTANPVGMSTSGKIEFASLRSRSLCRSVHLGSCPGGSEVLCFLPGCRPKK